MAGCPPDDAEQRAAKNTAAVQEAMDAVVRAWATTRAGINVRQGPIPPWLVERFWLAQRGLAGDRDAPALPWEPLPMTEAARIRAWARAAGIDVHDRAPVPHALRALYGRGGDPSEL